MTDDEVRAAAVGVARRRLRGRLGSHETSWFEIAERDEEAVEAELFRIADALQAIRDENAPVTVWHAQVEVDASGVASESMPVWSSERPAREVDDRVGMGIMTGPEGRVYSFSGPDKGRVVAAAEARRQNPGAEVTFWDLLDPERLAKAENWVPPQ